MKNIEVVVLLGNTNSNDGVLSSIAITRADLASNLLIENPRFTVIPTGGYGIRFNRSNVPHGELLSRYLIQKGIRRKRIWPIALGTNTLEDAKKVLNIIHDINYFGTIHVVTSEYHLERVKYIFERIFKNYTLIFYSAKNPEDQTTLKKLNEHEIKSLHKLKATINL